MSLITVDQPDISLERGIRQGDPHSEPLALDVLLIHIRENADIKGIMVDETEIKLSAYAGIR